MTLIARPIADTCIDTSTKLSRSEAIALYAAGVRAIWRYVFFGPPRPGDLDADELRALLDVGHTVCVVQHVREPGWTPSSFLGSEDADWAVKNAAACGYTPLGVLACDLEGARASTDDYATRWCDRIRQAGYQPAVYVGYASGITGAQLDALPGAPLFWRDFGPTNTRPQPLKGYTLQQHAQETLVGVGVDRNTILGPGIAGLADVDLNIDRDEDLTPPLPFDPVSFLPPKL